MGSRGQLGWRPLPLHGHHRLRLAGDHRIPVLFVLQLVPVHQWSLRGQVGRRPPFLAHVVGCGVRQTPLWRSRDESGFLLPVSALVSIFLFLFFFAFVFMVWYPLSFTFGWFCVLSCFFSLYLGGFVLFPRIILCFFSQRGLCYFVLVVSLLFSKKWLLLCFI